MEFLIYPFTLLTSLMMGSIPMKENDTTKKVTQDMHPKASNDPIIPALTSTSTSMIEKKSGENTCPLLIEMQKLKEEEMSQEQAALDLMWDKIQELKQTDEFAAQVMYEKYRVRAGELPPPIPYSCHIIEDQAVS